MTQLRLSHPGPSFAGPLIWTLVALVTFGVLYAVSGPRGTIVRELNAAGPDHVTAFFSSPEAAVQRINEMAAEKHWTELARYFDFSFAPIKPQELMSGAYFEGGEGASAHPRPFPPGWHFLYAEKAEREGMVRVSVAPPEGQKGTAQSLIMERLPEGYRIVPPEALERMPAETQAP